MFIILWFLVICLSATDQSNVSSWYKSQIISTVVPPYQDAYATLNDKIVQKLLTVDINSNETMIQTLTTSLICASQYVQNKLHIAVNASEDIRNSLDEQITQLVLSMSDQECIVKERQEAVHQANINIQHIQERIKAAENIVQDKQHALHKAEHDVHEAERAVERARLCRGRRRRKRGFGKWWRKKVEKPFVKIIRQTVIKPVCTVINSGGIDNAKDRRALAQRTLHDARQHLVQQQHLVHQQIQHSIAQKQLNEANVQLKNLTNQLHEQQTQQSVITSLIKQFKNVEIHLKNVLDSSIVLEDTLSQLINFELVINPLNTIYNEIIKNNVINSFHFEISSEITQQILNNIKLLSNKMPKMPLNDILLENTNIICNQKIQD